MIIQSLTSAFSPIEIVVFVTPSSFQIFSRINGVEKAFLSEVCFDSTSEPAICSAHKHALAKAQELLKLICGNQEVA